jgi:predicted nucleic acid-binding protein
VIVVDTNYFLRALAEPVTPQDETMGLAARTLFRRVARGEDVFTTTDAVIAEVVFAFQRHYGLARADVVTRLIPIIGLHGCKLPTKNICIRALHLWQNSPKISFVDAICAIQAHIAADSLATFDANLGKVAGVPIWEPPASKPERS